MATPPSRAHRQPTPARLAAALALAAFLLSACNFTLAADITPPPGYVPPSPLPTLGPLRPAQPPDLVNGAAIYAENCLPCHGESGLGDGPQGQQLPVPVAALGLPETAHTASPASWFTTVSQGNIDRFMPPFVSLSEQERWDVVAYALSLHTTPQLIQEGRELFESNCGGCALDFFIDQEVMAGLSDDDLVQILRAGNAQVPAFGANLSEDGLYAVAAYLRTLSFDSGHAEAAATETPVAGVDETAAAAETPLEGTTQPGPPTETPVPGTGTVNGIIENRSGAAIPENLTVSLRGFDHGPNASGPQETFSLSGPVESDGSFAFEAVELPEERLLLAEVTYDGISYQSEFAVVEAGASHIALPPITIYESNGNLDNLTFEQVHVAFDFGANDSFQIFEIYTFSNRTNQAVYIEAAANSIPFVAVPAAAQDVGFQDPNTNPLVPTRDGFAVLPSADPYSLIVFFNLPYDARRTDVELPFVVAAESVLVFLPEGLSLQSSQFAESGVQQVSNTSFQTYTARGVRGGDTLAFALSGRPRDDQNGGLLGGNQNLIYGAGALGLALIVAGAWMYLRDRSRPGADVDLHDDFEDPEGVMDAIIAIDDLHRAGKLPDPAYQARRAELKERLRQLQ